MFVELSQEVEMYPSWQCSTRGWFVWNVVGEIHESIIAVVSEHGRQTIDSMGFILTADYSS